MAPQDVFKNLPPELQAMALAGHYLQSFALMESALNDAIADALRLDGLQKLIVCKNIQFRDKQKILRTLVSAAFIPLGEKTEYDTMLLRMGDCSIDRNMVAHDVFGPPENGEGIEFLTVKASGKLSFPKNHWSVDDVEAKSVELLSISEKLRALRSRFNLSAVVKALLDNQDAANETISPETTQGPLAQALLGLAPHQPPSIPSSDPQVTTNAKPPETPQAPRAE